MFSRLITLILMVFCTGCVTIKGNVAVDSPYAGCRIIVENNQIAIAVRPQYARMQTVETIERLPQIEENENGPEQTRDFWR